MKTIQRNTLRAVLRCALLIVPILVLALPLQAESVNNSAGVFMRMGVGARVIAMGEAGSTITRDVASGFWNPAGLVMLKDVEVGTMYNFGMNLDRSHTYAAIGKRFSFGSMALSWVNAGTSDIEGYDDLGNPTGVFSDNAHNFAISYANEYKRLAYGITPKFYVSTLDNDTKAGMGLDIGAKYDINQYLEAGLMLRDLLGGYAGDKVPIETTIGVAAYPFIGVTVAADFKWEQAENPYFALGAEYWTSIGKDPEADSQLNVMPVKERNTWKESFSYAQTGIRIGFNQGRFSLGTGIRFRNFQLDYAYRLNNNDIMSDDHIVSMIFRF
jgi:hypothetical protein